MNTGHIVQKHRTELIELIAKALVENVSESLISRRLPSVKHKDVTFYESAPNSYFVQIYVKGRNCWVTVKQDSLTDLWQKATPERIRNDVIEILSVKAQYIEVFNSVDELSELRKILEVIQ